MKELVYHRQLLPAVERFGDRLGISDGTYEATWAEHLDRTLRIGNALEKQLGVGPGDRFAILAGNDHRFLELYHAGFLGTGIINPLNIRQHPSELAYILADSGTRVLFTDATFGPVADQLRDEVPGLETVVLMGEADIPHDARYEDLVGSGEAVVPPEPEEDDPLLLMYTGGTTGRPKGVLIDQRAQILNAYHMGMRMPITESDVFLIQVPMFHAAAMPPILNVPPTGARIMLVPFFDPTVVLRAVEEQGVTMTGVVPTMIAMLFDHPDFAPERLSSLRWLGYGASPMPPTLLGRLADALPHVELAQGYGMTEACAAVTWLTPEDHRRGGRMLDSVGRPVPGMWITIQDQEGNRLKTGETGEVCLRAGNLMREYWGLPETTEEAFRDDWYHTGDAGYLDDEGYLYLVDRVKDMIVSGGENVYSVEVENAIASHPSVAQVAVIGVPDETWGEAVHAIVVPHEGQDPSPEEIQEHARSSLAGYKTPKTVELRAEPLPLSGAMKPLKRELRRPYWEGRQGTTD